MRMNLCYALMALLGLAPFMGANAQYGLTIESDASSCASERCTVSTSKPTTRQTKFLLFLATIRHLW